MFRQQKIDCFNIKPDEQFYISDIYQTRYIFSANTRAGALSIIDTDNEEWPFRQLDFNESALLDYNGKFQNRNVFTPWRRTVCSGRLRR